MTCLQTIFEIGSTANSDVWKVMREKRMKDQKVVEKHRLTKPEVTVGVDFDSNVGAGLDSGGNFASGVATNNKSKHDENFIPYLPTDHHTESG